MQSGHFDCVLGTVFVSPSRNLASAVNLPVNESHYGFMPGWPTALFSAQLWWKAFREASSQAFEQPFLQLIEKALGPRSFSFLTSQNPETLGKARLIL